MRDISIDMKLSRGELSRVLIFLFTLSIYAKITRKLKLFFSCWLTVAHGPFWMQFNQGSKTSHVFLAFHLSNRTLCSLVTKSVWNLTLISKGQKYALEDFPLCHTLSTVLVTPRRFVRLGSWLRGDKMEWLYHREKKVGPYDCKYSLPGNQSDYRQIMWVAFLSHLSVLKALALSRVRFFQLPKPLLCGRSKCLGCLLPRQKAKYGHVSLSGFCRRIFSDFYLSQVRTNHLFQCHLLELGLRRYCSARASLDRFVPSNITFHGSSDQVLLQNLHENMRLHNGQLHVGDQEACFVVEDNAGRGQKCWTTWMPQSGHFQSGRGLEIPNNYQWDWSKSENWPPTTLLHLDARFSVLSLFWDQ